MDDLGCLPHLLVASAVAVGNFGHSCLGLGMVVGDQEWLAVQVFACQRTQESGDLQSLVSVDPGWTPVFLGLWACLQPGWQHYFHLVFSLDLLLGHQPGQGCHNSQNGMEKSLRMFLKQEEAADLLTLVAYHLVQMFVASSSFVWALGSSFAPFVVASFVLVLVPSSDLPAAASFVFVLGPSSGLPVGASFVLVLGPFGLVAEASFALASDQPDPGVFAVVLEVSSAFQIQVRQVS